MKLKLLCILFLFLLSSQVRAQDIGNIKNQKPVKFAGSTELRGIFYNASGIGNRRAPFSWYLTGSPVISIYGWQVPFSFIFSKDDKSFQQPFNQFGMSPTYKWLTIHAGYRNVSFSPFTLDGHTVLGGGFEMTPGKLRLGFMYGRLNRATVIDTTTQSLIPYSFSRKGYAGKIGLGTERNYFDLNFLRAKDDSSSAPRNAHLLPEEEKILPASNSIIGYGTRFTLFKNIVFESDGAASLYTYDINSPTNSMFTVDNKWKPWLNRFDINATSEWALAVNGSLGYQQKNYGIKLNYRRIEPGFQSMGSYFVANDLENWTVNPNFTLRNNRIRFNGSMGVQRDNIRNQKQASNKRFIASLIAGAEVNKQLGIDVNYSNFSNTQKPKTLSFADSLKIVQTTNTFSVMPRYSIVGEDVNHMIFFMANFNSMKDFSSYYSAQSGSRDFTTKQFSLNYNISFPKNQLNAFTALSYTDVLSGNTQSNYSGISLGGNYSFHKSKIQTGLNSSFMRNTTNSGKGNIVNCSANINYAINKMNTVRLMMFLTKNNPGTAVLNGYPSFTETRAELSYQFNFDF